MDANPKLVSMAIIVGAALAILLTVKIAEHRSSRLRKAGDARAASRVFTRSLMVAIWGFAGIWVFVKLDPLRNPITLQNFPWKSLAIALAVGAALTFQLLWFTRRIDAAREQQMKTPGTK